MAGLNIIFDEGNFTDHGSINESWFGPLDEGHSGYICTIRLVEAGGLYFVLREENFTQLRGIFREDPREGGEYGAGVEGFASGGYTGAHVREDGRFSVGTPYKAFHTPLVRWATDVVLHTGNGVGLRVDACTPKFSSEEENAKRRATIAAASGNRKQ